MPSPYGDNVFCQSNLNVSTAKTKWIDGPCRVHSIFVIPGSTNITEPAYLDFWSGDPDSGGVKTLSVPIMWGPNSTMQGSVYIKIPMNGIRFTDTVYAKITGAVSGEPSCTSLTYSGAMETIPAA